MIRVDPPKVWPRCVRCDERAVTSIMRSYQNEREQTCIEVVRFCREHAPRELRS